MFNWVIKQLETVLGRTVTGFIGFFALGIFVVWAMPKYVVTTEIFEREVKNIHSKMNKGDKWQKIYLIKLEKVFWDAQLYELQSEIKKIQAKGNSPTPRQEDLRETYKSKLVNLNKDEAEIQKSLEQ